MASLDITSYKLAIKAISRFPKDTYLIDLGRVDRIIPIIANAYAQSIPEDIIFAAIQSVTEPQDLEFYLLQETQKH